MTTIAERQKVVSEERAKFIEGLPKFLKLEEGSNKVEITSDEVSEGKYGFLYPAVVNGNEGVLSLKGVLEQLVLEQLENGKNKFTINRVGTNTDTRYSVK